jgi:hypothetical protein
MHMFVCVYMHECVWMHVYIHIIYIYIYIYIYIMSMHHFKQNDIFAS